MEELTSPTASSVNGSDDDPGDHSESQWVSSQQSQSDHHSAAVDAAATPSNSPEPSAATMQKRRRKAEIAELECTYDQPSNRRRNPAPQYVEALENRLRKAEELLREVLPNINLDDSKYNANVPARTYHPIKPEREPPPAGGASDFGPQPSFSQAVAKAEEDSLLESMVHEAGALDLDDQGHWDFYGQSSGLVFLRLMREQFGDLLGKSDGTNIFMKSCGISGRLSSPQSASQSPINPGFTNVHDLPAKTCARKLCSCALDDAAALLRFVHQPSFYAMFDRIYSTPPEEFTPTDQKFLPLLYAVLALGCLFAKAEESMLQSYGYESAIDQGYAYCAKHYPNSQKANGG
ncbi:MAG: hypothetical protein LQ338_004632 [Usnochroma carphineum]|nr:MAG: hypothetical protein LQ338_004632 [Usnochroma carphineum]